MKRGKALLAIFSAGLLLTACGNPSKKGVEYLEKGEYDQAVEQFEQAIEKNKNTGDAWRGIGIVKWEQKDYKGARNAFRKALDNNAEKTGTIYNLIGNCDLKLGKAKEALNYYNLGLEQDDVSKKMKKEMKYNIIVAYEKMEDWESAEVKLEEYLDMISRKEQWKPEFWLRYAWSVYRHYFGHRKEFIKVRQCFSVFGGIKWCTVDDGECPSAKSIISSRIPQ